MEFGKNILKNLENFNKKKLQICRFAFTVISNLIVFGLMWTFLNIDERHERQILPDNAPQFRDVALIVCAIGLVFTVLFHLGIKEPRNPRRAPVRKSSFGASGTNSGSTIAIVKDNEIVFMKWSDWFKRPAFYQVYMRRKVGI